MAYFVGLSGCFRPILGLFGSYVGLFWAFRGLFWGPFSRFQAYLDLSWAYMALCGGGGYFRVILSYWTYSEGMLGVLLGFFGPNLTFLAIFGQFGPVFVVLGPIW